MDGDAGNRGGDREDMESLDRTKEHKTGGERISAVVLSAGSGRRMGTEVPKQYLDLCGRPVLAWTLQAFQDCPQVSDIVLVTGQRDQDRCRREIVDAYGLTKVSRIVPGGSSRGESVLCGLRQMNPKPSFVLVHDGARPLLDQVCLGRLIDAVRENGAAILAVPARDTIKVADEGDWVLSTPDRATLRQVQTPQAFVYELIRDAYERAIRDGVLVTDDSMAAEYAGCRKIKLVEGSPANLKITTPEDMVVARALIEARGARGY